MAQRSSKLGVAFVASIAVIAVASFSDAFVMPVLRSGKSSYGVRRGTRRDGGDIARQAHESRRDAIFATAAAAAAGAAVAVLGISKAASAQGNQKYPLQGDGSIMSQKSHGTTEKAIQDNLRWNVDRGTADRICSYNRDYAEYAGYWRTTKFLKEVNQTDETFYDSVTGKPLFKLGARSFKDFKNESGIHGWPSFRDEEVVWENVRCLPDGECVSVDGTHLGHNLPDRSGNRYCINLVSIAGRPPATA
eukprot:TRINITY_DN26173_c0_g1_i1.p1 TRINITY_DN26173_c0_g1~~TRINITY_DN26173_c0_g1_i1.p1  ORF type:complete len:285 (+),score=43.53 TRINITY_DN26173_c0_g1_i1:114-857(+)